jgi:N-acyl-D-amino-acid deacylase
VPGIRVTPIHITDGAILDGSGAPAYMADLLIVGGRIVDIIPAGTPMVEGRVPANAGALDATGLVIAPGFIDIHSHSDFTLLVDPRAVSSIAQGVTLEVVGNCGHGCAPIADPAAVTGNIYGYRAGFELNWNSMAGYLARLEAARPAVNVLSLVPNGNLRLAAAGLVDRSSSPDELRQMKKLLAQSLEEGAFGFSTGLEYGAEQGCAEDEIAELCRVTAAAGGYYATHTRNRAGEAVETIAEPIRASAATGTPLQISHISVVSRLADDGRWAVEQALAQVDAARAQGLDVAFDMHTRLFGTTNLSAALPPWAAAGTASEIAARLRDPAVRRQLNIYHSIITALARGDWRRIVLFDSLAQPELSRRSIYDISAARGVEPLDAIYDILLAELDVKSDAKAGARSAPTDAANLHRLMIVAFAYREEDVRIAFEHPLCMVGSDATALAPDGPLAGTSFHGAYTWAGWYYRHFVRETRIFKPEAAIRRITSLPAQRLGLRDRGLIQKGAWADLAIFDPAKFAERGTTFEPNQTATGMRHVLVNGVFAVRDGALTGQRPGHVLRHE